MIKMWLIALNLNKSSGLDTCVHLTKLMKAHDIVRSTASAVTVGPLTFPYMDRIDGRNAMCIIYGHIAIYGHSQLVTVGPGRPLG